MIHFLQQILGYELFCIIFKAMMVLFFVLCCFVAMEISHQLLTRDDLFIMSSKVKASNWILILIVMISFILYTRIKSGQKIKEMNELRPIVLLYEQLSILQPVLENLTESTVPKETGRKSEEALGPKTKEESIISP